MFGNGDKMKKYEGIAETDSEGKLNIFSRNQLDNFFKSNKGKRFQFTFVQVDKSKTSEQVRYYWGVIIPRCTDAYKELGNAYTNQDTHRALCSESPAMYNETIIHEGKEFHRERSMSDDDFSISDMKEHIDYCIRFAAENLEIQIPDPI